MVTSSTRALDPPLQLTHVWLHDLMDRLGWGDRQRAYRALRAVLHALRDCVSPDASSRIAVHLPVLIYGCYYEGYQPAEYPLPDGEQGEFLARVAEKYCETGLDYAHVVRAVFETLASQIAVQASEGIRGVIPPMLQTFWPNPGKPGGRIPFPPPAPANSLDKRGGPNRRSWNSRLPLTASGPQDRGGMTPVDATA